MAQPKNAMEIFQLLDKSNCRECGQKTCLAFAGAVFRGQSQLELCPKLDRETIERFSGDPKKEHTVEEIQEAYMNDLKLKLSDLDFDETAQRTGGRVSKNKLTLKVLGKDFSVDSRGHLYTDIHINMWVAIPFLTYVVYGKGVPVSEDWVSFRELKGGMEQHPLFQKRCEEPMQRIADTYTDLFDDMVHIFSGKKVEKQFESDISVVLYPLPKVPIMVCYWLPEDGLESSLHVFFDKTADENLGTDAVFTLGVGLSQMFGKLALRHGFSEHR
jgi:hypothetical protein